MNVPFETLLIIVSSLLLLCVLISKVSDRFGIPLLLLFLGIGMLAGSEGIGGIYFDDPHLTQQIANICLALILFSSGLDTAWKDIRKVAREGILLATLGVILTAAVFGVIVHALLKITWLESLLIGAIISSTDAAAVFSILRSRGVRLPQRLSSLLELESGSNDPMAVILTVSLLTLMTAPQTSLLSLLGLLVLQIGVGVLVGWLFAQLALFLINRLRLGVEGLYPVLSLALVMIAFAVASLLKGSPFLAVYLLGLLMGKKDFLHRHSTMRFLDTSAWLSQIVLFLTLGLLVFPSRVIQVAGPALLLAVSLVLLARPVAVFLTLFPFRYSWREKLFASWVGLRGAVPIVLATYPLVAGVQDADLIFNIVFFVVITSVLLQGTFIPQLARWLQLEAPGPEKVESPLALIHPEALSSQLIETTLPVDAACAGKSIMELQLPAGYLIILIHRGQEHLQPNGSTVLQSGDTLLALSDENALAEARAILLQARSAESQLTV